ncbi:MAG: iron donor protein CyaY [Planctomycetes bacterium]|nr:iron donor protein CyaY [Planctomycetota bacterium]
MDKQQFVKLSDACLARVADWLEPFDPDELDYSTSDGVVTLVFPGNVRYVLNRQSATNQMWFAAGARAWHYNWDEARQAWFDDRDGHALYERIAQVVGDKLKRSVSAP